MFTGLVPRLNRDSLYIAIGILGATVMPHNLVPAFGAGADPPHRPQHEPPSAPPAAYNLIDSVVALNGALLVNAAILVLAAAVFFKRGIVVTEIQQAHVLLVPLLGTSRRRAIFSPWRCCAPGNPPR